MSEGRKDTVLRLRQEDAQRILDHLSEARASLDAQADIDESGDCLSVAEKLDHLLRDLEGKTGLTSQSTEEAGS